jgi:hypothetical protein
MVFSQKNEANLSVYDLKSCYGEQGLQTLDLLGHTHKSNKKQLVVDKQFACVSKACKSWGYGFWAEQ